MEALVLVAGLFILFWFKNSIKKTAYLAEVAIDVTADTSEDSLKTYRNEISIMNAEKRSEQVGRISKLDTVVTNKEIEDLLASAGKPSEAAA